VAPTSTVKTQSSHTASLDGTVESISVMFLRATNALLALTATIVCNRQLCHLVPMDITVKPRPLQQVMALALRDQTTQLSMLIQVPQLGKMVVFALQATTVRLPSLHFRFSVWRGNTAVISVSLIPQALAVKATFVLQREVLPLRLVLLMVQTS